MGGTKKNVNYRFEKNWMKNVTKKRAMRKWNESNVNQMRKFQIIVK